MHFSCLYFYIPSISLHRLVFINTSIFESNFCIKLIFFRLLYSLPDDWTSRLSPCICSSWSSLDSCDWRIYILWWVRYNVLTPMKTSLNIYFCDIFKYGMLCFQLFDLTIFVVRVIWYHSIIRFEFPNHKYHRDNTISLYGGLWYDVLISSS